MWWAAISFGSFLFEIFGLPASTSLPDEVSFGIIWDLLKTEPFRIFLPWAVGGYLLGFLSMIVTYPIFLNLVKGAKLARKKARERKLHKERQKLTRPVK